MCVTFEDLIKSQARVKGRKPKTEATLFLLGHSFVSLDPSRNGEILFFLSSSQRVGTGEEEDASTRTKAL